MRAHPEPSDADTLVYVDVKKIASELERIEEVDVDEIEQPGELDVADSLRGSEASIRPQAPAKARSRYPLAVFALLIGLATILALQAEKGALPGSMSALVRRVRGRLGASSPQATLSSSAAQPAPTAPPATTQAVAAATAGAAPVPQRAASSASLASMTPRADATLDRERGSSLAGTAFEILPDFSSEDGKYDLIVHFHGDASVVVPELARARLNAVVVVVNLGLSSGSYDQKFAGALLFPAIVSNAARTLTERGLRAPSLRRLAVTAWSAGYAAVKRILDEPGAIEQIDSVILLDGIHTALLAYPKRPDPSRLAMFVRFAKEAVAGRKLLSITHSEIDPFEFVGTHKSTDLLLDEVGVSRRAVSPEAAPAGAAAVNPATGKWPMELTSEAHQGGLTVRGYAGTTKEDHLAHVGQMASTALPDLAKRWAVNP